MSHWEVLAAEPPEFAAYYSGNKAIHIRAKKLPPQEGALKGKGKGGKGNDSSKGAEARFRSKSRGQERLQAPDTGTVLVSKRALPSVRLSEEQADIKLEEEDFVFEKRPPWRKTVLPKRPVKCRKLQQPL